MSEAVLTVLLFMALGTPMMFLAWKDTKNVGGEKDIKPICGCTHHLCYHDSEGCHSRFGYNPCGCKKYIQKDTPENVALYSKEFE